jgi:hypothetical protein
MFRYLLDRIKQRSHVSRNGYGRSLARYRREHPESVEEENKRIHEWILYIEKRKQEQKQVVSATQAERERVTEALHRMQETARKAFMSHPAATEMDFRRCWPSIREELLKRHALEELAGNPILSKRLLADVFDDEDILGISEITESRLQLIEKSDDPN